MITKRGFTFIELLIVIAIITVLLGLSVPVGINFYRKQQLDTVTNGIVQALRRAQLKAMSQADYSFGVYVDNGYAGEYILFRGDSYGASDDQESFNVPSSFSFSGLSEIVFSELKGIPSATGSIVFTSGNNIGTIYINEFGKISYEYSSGSSGSPEFCWGIEESCDSSCQYSDYGGLTDYYVDPGCIEKCSPAGSFYVSYAGVCSDDGTGLCYKMEDPSTQYLSCSQGDSCESKCEGICTPCWMLNEEECTQQEGCFFLGGPGGSRCSGRCTFCEKFDDEGGCGGQLGCEWKSTKWYWVLNNSFLGYSTSTKCEWYEI